MLKEAIDRYLDETNQIVAKIDRGQIAKMTEIIQATKDKGGRLFFLGIGGSAGNCSHAVNDFRKIARIETYSPCDNLSEFSAWANDKGFEFTFSEWLTESKVRKDDTVMVFSVGGGSETTSKNLVLGMQKAKEAGAKVVSCVSRDGGMALKLSDACVLIPVVNKDAITPHAEGWQMVISHLVVNLIK